jgi:hypothetical protein
MSTQFAEVHSPLSVTPRECRTIGCGGLSYDADYCGDCAAQVVAIHEWHQRRVERRETISGQPSGSRIRPMRSP